MLCWTSVFKINKYWKREIVIQCAIPALFLIITRIWKQICRISLLVRIQLAWPPWLKQISASLALPWVAYKSDGVIKESWWDHYTLVVNGTCDCLVGKQYFCSAGDNSLVVLNDPLQGPMGVFESAVPQESCLSLWSILLRLKKGKSLCSYIWDLLCKACLKI